MGTSNDQAHPEMTKLLKTFPVLKNKLAYWPWGVGEVGIVKDAYWGASSGEKCAIEFLLSVWDHDVDWSQRGFENFNLARTVGMFGGSGQNVDAIVGWIQEPFFP